MSSRAQLLVAIALAYNIAAAATIGLALSDVEWVVRAVDGSPLFLPNIHRVLRPFLAGWSLRGWLEPGTAAWMLFAVPLATGLALLRIEPTDGHDGPRFDARPVSVFVGLLCAAFLGVATSRNAVFGDGYVILAHLIGRSSVFGAELGTAQLLRMAIGFGTHFELATPIAAIRCLEAVLLGVTLCALSDLARTLGRTTRSRLVLVVALPTVGTIVQYLGYVETTVLESTALSVFMAAGARLARGRTTVGAELAAWGALGVGVLAHGAGLLVAPAALMLLVVSPRRGRALAMAVALVLVPFLFVVAPEWASGNIGNGNGGGDAQRFVPWTLPAVRPPESATIYAWGSAPHLIDLANLLLIGAPTLLLAVLTAPLAPRVRREELLLVLAAAGTLVIPFFWNHDFGMWGDWNLGTAYLLPAHVAAWTLLLARMDELRVGRHAYAAVVTLLLAVQFAGLVGLGGQFVLEVDLPWP